MERSPSWEANSRSASQEILCILLDSVVDYRAQKGRPLVSILSQMHPVHTLPPYFHKTHRSIIFPFMHTYSSGLFPFMFSNLNTVYTPYLSHACYMAFQSRTWLDHRNNIGEAYEL
jgi:hypothetical protein